MPYDPLFDTDTNKTLMAICTRRLIRNIGIGGIIWGLINVAIGGFAVTVSPINAGILVLGLLMLGTGIQALRHPTLNVLLAETVVTVLLLGWNIAMAVINVGADDRFDPRGILFPLVIAITFAGNYRKLGHLRAHIASVPPEKIAETKKVCKALLKKKLKQEPRVVQTSNARCRAQLLDGQAFFIQRDMMRAFIGTREEVRAAVSKPEAKAWTTVFNHPLGKLSYRFDKKQTAKLRDWLDTASVPATP